MGKNPSDKYKYRLFIKITDICNYQCSICGNWKKKENRWLSSRNQKRIIEKFSNQLFFLTITGGEPFLDSKSLVEFIKKIKAKNPNLKYVSINTNCSLPGQIGSVVTDLITQFPDLKFFIGLHFIPNSRWGVKKTGVKNSFNNYKETLSTLQKIEAIFPGNLTYYKIITINNREDIKVLKGEVKEKKGDIWLNFAQIDSFYNNKKNNKVGKIAKKQKTNLIDYFLENNRENLSFLNRRYLKGLKKTIQKGRFQKCYAGINRSFINEKGEEFICFKSLNGREEMNPKKCKYCWSSCESNFDFIPSFFIPSFFKGGYK